MGFEFSILENPTINELKKYCTFLKKNYINGNWLRFMVNFETKKIYFWPGHVMIHYNMVNDYLYKEFGKYPANIYAHNYRWYAGSGHLYGNKIEHDTDTIKAHMGTRSMRYLKNVDDRWTEKYFDRRLSLEILDLIDQYKHYYEHYYD